MISSTSPSTNIFFTAQKEAGEALHSHVFPLYVENGTLARSLCNRVHYCLGEVHKLTLRVSDAVYTLFNTLYTYVEAPLKPLIDTFYPINPINGKRYISLISRETEQWLGDRILFPWSTINFMSTYEHLPNTSEKMSSIVDEVVGTLYSHNKDLLNPPGETPFTYSAQTVADSGFNAFAFPGGNMVFFSQLLKQVAFSDIKDCQIRFEDGSVATVNLEGIDVRSTIAFLAGHEMTHVASRHFVTLIVEWLTHSTFLYVTEPLLRDGSIIASYLARCFTSRKREFEADIGGAYFASKAGFDPRGALYLMQFLVASKSPQVRKLLEKSEFLLSHPQGNSRLLSLFAAISTFAPESLQGKVTWSHPPASPYDLKGASPALLSAGKVEKRLRDYELAHPPKEDSSSFLYKYFAKILSLQIL